MPHTVAERFFARHTLPPKWISDENGTEWVLGHVEVDLALDCLKALTGEDFRDGRDPPGLKHVWMRSVGPDGYWDDAWRVCEKADPGAFPFTQLDF